MFDRVTFETQPKPTHRMYAPGLCDCMTYAMPDLVAGVFHNQFKMRPACQMYALPWAHRRMCLRA